MVFIGKLTEFFKQLGKIFLLDAYASVFDADLYHLTRFLVVDLVIWEILIYNLFIGNRHGNISGGSKFQWITNQIYQYLPYAEGVRGYDFRHIFCNPFYQLNVLGFRLNFNQAKYIFNQGFYIKWLNDQWELTVLFLRLIE